jgi:hypothetical protein
MELEVKKSPLKTDLCTRESIKEPQAPKQTPILPLGRLKTFIQGAEGSGSMGLQERQKTWQRLFILNQAKP